MNHMKEARKAYEEHASALYSLGTEHVNYQQAINLHRAQMFYKYSTLRDTAEEKLETMDNANKPPEITYEQNLEAQKTAFCNQKDLLLICHRIYREIFHHFHLGVNLSDSSECFRE